MSGKVRVRGGKPAAASVHDGFNRPNVSIFERMLLQEVERLGGFLNAHSHLDRADTLHAKYLAHINTSPLVAASMPLTVKQNLTGDLHRGLAYNEADLRERVSALLERQISYGITRVITCVDACPGIAEDGLLAWRVMRELKKEFAGRLQLLLGPNAIFGFKEGTERWETYQEAAKTADVLTGLPEKDEFSSFRTRDGRVGFKQHINRILRLAIELDKPVQLHLDQADDPRERGTWRLIEVLESLEVNRELEPLIRSGEPRIWAVHMISPSGYPEVEFRRLADKLREYNVGVTVCPTAAISMRRYRPLSSPTHSCIARVLELLKLGVRVQLGSDNIADVFVPASNGDMLTEVMMAAHGLRFYSPTVWAKIVTGHGLNSVDVATVGDNLYQDSKAFTGIDPEWQSAV